MDEQVLVMATAGVLLAYFLCHAFTRKFDPFAPVWLFLLGYVQVYVIQAFSYHDWALEVRGKDLVTAANARALWAILWFLAVYQFGAGRFVARLLPAAAGPGRRAVAAMLSPPLIVWGLFFAGVMIKGGVQAAEATSAEESLLRSFPFVMMVAAVMLIVTGRTRSASPALVRRGRTHGGGLLCRDLDVQRQAVSLPDRRALHGLRALHLAREAALLAGADRHARSPGPWSWAIAIGWRNNSDYELSAGGFTEYLSDFKLAKVFESLNIEEQDGPMDAKSHETTEYGGFLLMMDTVPEKSGYDYGMSYIRIVSTFIPRIVWPTKPLFGREPVGERLDRRLGAGAG